MKILVLGSLERARALLRGRRGDMRQVFHCAKDIRVTRSFSPIDPPDWILIEENVLATEGQSLLQPLRTMDFYTARDQDQGGACGNTGAGVHPGICRLERDAAGMMRLHCGMQQAAEHGPAAKGRDPDQGEAAICFEYQAPLPWRNS